MTSRCLIPVKTWDRNYYLFYLVNCNPIVLKKCKLFLKQLPIFQNLVFESVRLDRAQQLRCNITVLSSFAALILKYIFQFLFYS